VITPPLDDQIEDMRLLQNAGFWEIAGRSSSMIVHSPSASPRIERETQADIRVLPFANQRVPDADRITVEDRQAAQRRLGLDASTPGTWHIASFGYVDSRTKMTDVVIEAAGWLTQWGYPVALNLVGAASDDQRRELSERATRAGLSEFQITGFQTEEQFRDWLLAVDIGVQLRVSPLLGVSGPLSDLAAFGTPAVASAGLCIDVDTPEFIHRLPDAVSSLMVAEAIEATLVEDVSHEQREDMRLEYLARKSPQVYARMLLDAIEASR
jgi:glycosyltransferase involved in cell wall biosynthesis